jgi:acyl dehydratase
MRQELDFHGPLPSETELTVRSKVLDIYEWRNRTVVLQNFEIYNDEDQLLGATRHHQSYLLGQKSGRVALRKPSDKEGVRKFNVPKGEEIDSVTSEIDLEMCGTFFHGNKNYHTDKRASEELGFDEVVVGGKMTISYIGDMLDRNFGSRWYEGGSLDVKFTNIVWPGDKVTARGVITDNVASDGTNRSEVNVWVEKEDGTVAMVGNAYLPQVV